MAGWLEDGWIAVGLLPAVRVLSFFIAATGCHQHEGNIVGRAKEKEEEIGGKNIQKKSALCVRRVTKATKSARR